jgi:hypothetical protein
MMDLTALSPRELLDLTQQTCVDPETRRALLDHPDLPLAGLLNLALVDLQAFASHPTIRLCAGTNPDFAQNLPGHLLVPLVKNDLLIGSGALQRLATSPKVSTEVRLALAASPRLSHQMTVALMRRGNRVRMALADNPNTQQVFLVFFSKSRKVALRAKVAKSCNLPRKTLEHLSRDHESSVRWGVAQNPNTPRAVLKALLSDSLPATRALARKALELPWIEENLAEWSRL